MKATAAEKKPLDESTIEIDSFMFLITCRPEQFLFLKYSRLHGENFSALMCHVFQNHYLDLNDGDFECKKARGLDQTLV